MRVDASRNKTRADGKPFHVSRYQYDTYVAVEGICANRIDQIIFINTYVSKDMYKNKVRIRFLFLLEDIRHVM